MPTEPHVSSIDAHDDTNSAPDGEDDGQPDEVQEWQDYDPDC